MLVIENLTVELGNRRILNNISISIKGGEILFLRGPNGCGKSTLLRTLMGLIRPTAGSIRWKCHSLLDVETDAIRRLGIAYLPQNALVFPGLTVRQNLNAACLAILNKRRMHRAAIKKSDIATILSPLLKNRAGLLSRGQKQMLALAMVLDNKADLFLLDEPFSPLSSDNRLIINQAIRDLAQKEGAAILIVELDTSIPENQRSYFFESPSEASSSYLKTRYKELLKMEV